MTKATLGWLLFCALDGRYLLSIYERLAHDFKGYQIDFYLISLMQARNALL